MQKIQVQIDLSHNNKIYNFFFQNILNKNFRDKSTYQKLRIQQSTLESNSVVTFLMYN